MRTYLLWGVAAIACLLATEANAGNLIGFYEFENNVNDSSGNGLNGTLYGTGTTYGTGQNGNGLVFNDGENDVVTVPINISPDQAPEVTIGAWVKLNSSTAYQAFLQSDGSYARKIGAFTFNNGAGTHYSSFQGYSAGYGTPVNDGGTNTKQPSQTRTIDTVNDGFMFVAASYNNRTGTTMTMAGNSVTTTTNSYLKQGWGYGWLNIGALRNSGGTIFEEMDGTIDNVFVIKGAATQAQLESIRDATNPLTAAQNVANAIEAGGPRKTWNLDFEASGGTTPDGMYTNQETWNSLAVTGTVTAPTFSSLKDSKNNTTSVALQFLPGITVAGTNQAGNGIDLATAGRDWWRYRISGVGNGLDHKLTGLDPAGRYRLTPIGGGDNPTSGYQSFGVDYDGDGVRDTTTNVLQANLAANNAAYTLSGTPAGSAVTYPAIGVFPAGITPAADGSINTLTYFRNGTSSTWSIAGVIIEDMRPAGHTWNHTSGSNWNSSSNWTPDSGMSGVPGVTVAGGSAMFNSTSGVSPITLDVNPTLAELSFSNSNFQLNSGTITLDSLDGIGRIGVAGSTSTEIGSTIALAAGTTSVMKYGTGKLTLSGTNTYTGATIIAGGALGAAWGTGLPTTSNVQLAGGVLESNGTMAVTLGTGGNQVQWISGGGFSANGGALTVTLNGGAALTWGSTANFVPTISGLNNPIPLVLGSTTADSMVELTNDIDLGAASRVVRVDDNAGSSGDSAKLSGVISGASVVEFIKRGNGKLWLSNNNTYAGNTTVHGGELKVTGSLTRAVDTNNCRLLVGYQADSTTGSVIFDMGSGTSTYYGDGWSNASVIADNGIASVTLQSGTLNIITRNGAGTSYGSLRLANGTTPSPASTGTLTVNGGTLNVDGRIIIANNATATGTLNINGGLVHVGTTAGAYNNNADPGNGVLWYESGLATVNLGNGTPGSGTLEMYGFSKFAAATNVLSTFNFNGGLLRMIANNSEFTPKAMTVYVKSGGAKIDTQAYNVDIARALLHDGGGPALDGGLTKSGSGILTLGGSSTYTGPTLVSDGTLKAGTASVAGVSGAFGLNSAVTMANVAGAALDITGWNTQIGSLTGGGATGGNVTLGANTLTVGGDNTSPAAYAGVISGTGGSLDKIGTGTQILSGANLYDGGTTVTDGTLQLNHADAVLPASNVTVTGAAKLALGGSTTVNLGSAVKVADLNINGHATTGLTATVDLNKSKMILDKTYLSVADARAQIKNAYASKTWTGAGITSGAAAADRALNGNSAKTGVGYLDNAIAAGAGGSLTTWQGRSVDSNSLLVRYTYYGDANLNGMVNLQDFGILKANYGTGSHWYQGDFDYSGTVNLADFGLLKAAYGSTPIAAGAAVPEPSIIALLLTGALAVGFRTRRRK